MNKEKRPEVNQLTVTGQVVLIKDKTVRIRLTKSLIHPLYQKRYTRNTSILAHLPDDKKVAVGETVTAVRTRPISKRKCWVITESATK